MKKMTKTIAKASEESGAWSFLVHGVSHWRRFRRLRKVCPLPLRIGTHCLEFCFESGSFCDAVPQQVPIPTPLNQASGNYLDGVKRMNDPKTIAQAGWDHSWTEVIVVY